MAACGTCGFANDDAARFCGSCGAPLTATCSRCDAPLASGLRFCTACGEPVPSAVSPPAEAEVGAGPAERRRVSVLFVDLENFTALAEHLDPEEVRGVQARYFEVARGVVARSVAALSKGPNRVLGYVENMSGYYCRDCNAIKPLFPSTRPPGGLAQDRRVDTTPDSPLEIPCLGTVPFDPELARHCDSGIPLTELPETPVGRALGHVAQQLLDSLESASAHASRELRPDREPPR